MLIALLKFIAYLFRFHCCRSPKRNPNYQNRPSLPDQLEARYLLAAPNPFALSALNGSNGFQINGIDFNDRSGGSVSSAGDINGDGFDDLIIGAHYADPNDNSLAGESYVVLGRASGFASAFDLGSLDGTNGFRLDGIDEFDFSGKSVSSAGDVNGDGFDDLIIGAYGAGDNDAGESYVIFGKPSSFPAVISLSTLDGTNGFRLNGSGILDNAGFFVSTAGDVNGDGFDDLIIGAENIDPNSSYTTADCYVVFGKSHGFEATINLGELDGTDGFRLDKTGSSDTTGSRVSTAGDVNGDGFDDLIIGAYKTDYSDAGRSYVVFGKSNGFAATVDLESLDGTNGFRLEGIDSEDGFGRSVSTAGDVNGDGFDDLIIGAFRADPNGNSSAGESYVVFGMANGFSAIMNMSTLDGTNGFRLDGIDSANHPSFDSPDSSGYSVSSAGDVNGDGFDDLVIGAHGADYSSGITDTGECYLIFGNANGFAATLSLNSLDGTNGFRLDGVESRDATGISVSAAGDVNGDGFDDLILGAYFGNSNGITNVGKSYVIFGGNFTGGIETQIGDSSANTLNGVYGIGLDVLIGGTGNDTLISDGGADVIRGGEGDDILAIIDIDFSSTRRLQGGNGQDTLRVTGAGLHLDLTAIADNRITDIEQIDLTGSGDNTLTLNQLEVLNPQHALQYTRRSQGFR